jgi:hypothetical protein
MAARKENSKGKKKKSPQNGGGVSIGGGINTGGGASIVGDVKFRDGTFVGRDQKTGISAEEIAALFEKVYAQIDAKTDLKAADKADLKATVDEAKAEVQKGEKADESFLARQLRNIGRMAPDILEVVLATLTSPAAGFAAVVRKVAEKAKAESGQA